MSGVFDSKFNNHTIPLFIRTCGTHILKTVKLIEMFDYIVYFKIIFLYFVRIN